MSDIHALSGAYAVDALDDIERTHFERHLATCGTCRREVDSLREAGALLAETAMTEPPSRLRERVLAETATVRPLPPVVTPSDDLRPKRPRWLPALVAAAAALVAIGGGAVVYNVMRDDSSSQPLSAVDRILQAEDAERFTNTYPNGVEATLVRSQSLDGAVLIAEEMQSAPSGRAYALWLQQDGVMVPAGVMSESADPAQGVLLTGDAATAHGAGVTLEAAGTEPTTPSDDVVALFDFGQV